MPMPGRIALFVIVFLCWVSGWSQTKPTPPAAPSQSQKELNVNWLYGAYVPKDVPLQPLTGHQRLKLYVLQTFTTPGIYLKTGLFALSDQVTNSPSEWGRGPDGFGRRLASREGQFVIQNSFSAVGNALLQYEPRYDLCRCSGFWPRTRHAFVRNFVTYNKTEKELRPQFALYGAALGAGMTQACGSRATRRGSTATKACSRRPGSASSPIGSVSSPLRLYAWSAEKSRRRESDGLIKPQQSTA